MRTLRQGLVCLVVVAGACSDRRSGPQPVETTRPGEQERPTRTAPQPTGACLSWANGVCVARAYTPAEAIAMATATSIRQAGSELDTSCTVVRDGVCMQGVHSERSCTEGHGVFRRAACPTQDAIGTCNLRDGAVVVVELENGRGYDANDLRDDCLNSQLPGTWTDGPRIADAPRRRAPVPSRIAGSCMRSDAVCRDYSSEDVSVSKATCSGTWSEMPCPTEHLAGTCRWADGMSERFYEPGPAKRRAARQAAWAKQCELADPVLAPLGRMGRGHWIAAGGAL